MSSSRLLDHPAALCNIVRRLAIEAGDILLDYFDESGNGEMNDPSHAPVTKAFRDTGALIRKTLEQTTPGVPVIGTDLPESLGMVLPPVPADATSFWLVDPLNGWGEYMVGGTDFTINIGLVKDAEPVLGVVYAPFAGELYAGHGPGTAIRWLADNGQDKEISVRPWPEKGLVVMASRFARNPHLLDKFLEGYKVARVARRGSSLKICAVAAGKADIYPRFTVTHWRETAAGDAILRSAGGIMLGMDTGEALRYDPTNAPTNPAFIATSER